METNFEQGQKVRFPIVINGKKYSQGIGEFLSYQGREYFEQFHGEYQAAFVSTDQHGTNVIKVPAELLIGDYDESIVEELLQGVKL